MLIDDLRTLRQVIALCKKQGVSYIEIDNVKLHLSPVLPNNTKPKFMSDIPEADLKVPAPNFSVGDDLMSAQIQAMDTVDKDVESFDELTDEQKLFYSARPEVPGEM